MRTILARAFLIALSACAGQPDQPAGALGKVQERKIVSSTMERSTTRPQMPSRERAMSSQPFQESVLRPVYEHVVSLEDGRTVRVQGTNAAHPPGSCVRVLESESPVRLSAGAGCSK